MESIKVEVIVEGFKHANGQLIVGVYNASNKFPDPKDVYDYRYLKIEGDVLRFTIEVEEEGLYAIAVQHDENGNGVLDKNVLGIPQEAYGFSNNPNIWFRAPTFDECKFMVGREPVKQVIRLKH